MSRIDETLELIDEALESYETQTDEIARRAWALFDDTSQPEGASWHIEADTNTEGIDWAALIQRMPAQRGAIEYPRPSMTDHYVEEYLAGAIDAAAEALGIPEEMLLPGASSGAHWMEVVNADGEPVRWFTPLDEDGNPITPS